MQLSFDAADRLVELVQARRGPVSAPEAARALFALRSAPEALARSLLEDVVAAESRLAWRGAEIGLADPPGAETAIEDAHFVVVDLETTGLTPRTARICEIGAQRVRALELADAFETFVDPGGPIPAEVTRITGIDRDVTRGAPRPETAVRRLLAFAGEAAIVAHNARFDLAFLDREVERFAGQRIASPVIDTVWLAKRLLGERTRKVGLGSLAHFLGVPTQPCHRALPDARATAEILVILLGLAQERGARTVADVVELAAPRARRLNTKRSLVAGAPTRPGTYVFRGAGGQPLYVGRARDLRARLRSYFAGGRQRPAVEAALVALERVEWEEAGSELEAALREQRLLRELRPPANARGLRPDRHVYLHRRGARWTAKEEPSPHGPLQSRGRASRAARALDGYEGDDPRQALAPLKAKLQRHAAAQRFEDAARLRDRITALEEVVGQLDELERLRLLEVCLVVPAAEPGFVRGYAVVGGRVAASRRLPAGPGALHEAAALVNDAGASPGEPGAVEADELRLVGSFIRRPPPELRTVPLDARAIAAAAGHAAGAIKAA
ncbi:MAG: exonuclease domain-containing protein [Gaiellales bacterium]